MYIIKELVERPRFNLTRRANCPPFLFGEFDELPEYFCG
jgi:hypothetical protein